MVFPENSIHILIASFWSSKIVHYPPNGLGSLPHTCMIKKMQESQGGESRPPLSSFLKSLTRVLGVHLARQIPMNRAHARMSFSSRWKRERLCDQNSRAQPQDICHGSKELRRILVPDTPF